MDDLPITITDIRQAGHCAKDLRAWFRLHDLEDEFKAMVKGGSIPAAKLLATGDPRAIRVVGIVAERERTNG